TWCWRETMPSLLASRPRACARTANARNFGRYPRSNHPSNCIRRVNNAITADYRPSSRRRHSSFLGVLEDVARLGTATLAVGAATLDDCHINRDGTIARGVRRKTFGQAALQIVAADVSMSLDNVLAVAGAARDHPIVLVFGLLLSITLMGVAANWVA